MSPDSTGGADSHHRKRSFDLVNNYQYVPSLQRPLHHGQAWASYSVDSHESEFAAPSNKRRPVLAKASTMPVEVASILSTPFPSVMSVVGQAKTTFVEDMADPSLPRTTRGQSQYTVTTAKPPSDTTDCSSRSLHHRDSVTSITTASTGSSPATTHSTFDSPLIPDPSPSSSPESASSNLPILPFRNIMVKSPQEQAVEFHRPQAGPVTETLNDLPAKPGMALEEPTKNVKNLSLNMDAVVLPRQATSHGFDPSHAFSAPPSPLKDTPRSGRRKPTNLTIRTPGFQQQTFSKTLDVPLTSESRPGLHHFQSSPALASLASPSKPPPQGLFLHLPPSHSVTSDPKSGSSSSGHSAGGALPDLKEEDEFHLQRSQETQEKGYPKGPVLIYDDGVYLYLEPTAEEASNFDTVINVAKEIGCPLEIKPEAPRHSISEPQTAISEISFKSAWEWPRPSDVETPVETPVTPRQRGLLQKKQPEYLHVPWDHNSEILEDLYTLCRLIDERVRAGKRVLIHCQLGVSRSASLVIAYGLFKGYQPDFHSMYMTVKQRSQWVGPNMSLIYQLTDFRSKVAKGAYGDHTYNPSPSWWKLQAQESPVMDTPIARQTLWERIPPSIDCLKMPAAASKPTIPSAARVRPPLRVNKTLPPVPLFPKQERNNLATPVTATSSVDDAGAQTDQERTTLAATPLRRDNSPLRSVPPRPLPFRERFEGIVESVVAAPKPSKSPRLGLFASSPKMDIASHDVPETPTLLSPRAAEFMASPFGITAAGDLAVPTLATGSAKAPLPPQQGSFLTSDSTREHIPSAFDPRSPHQQGEVPEIFRNIDGVL
ncbi:hypothetical protein ABEF91_007174 [Exophiala dermatitidis]